MKKWLLLIALFVPPLAAQFMLPPPAMGHAPQQHGFELTTFKRPPPAPEFLLTSPTGAPITLKQFRGKVVLLNFWATWCPPCVREMPSMEALYQKFKAKGFVVLAISLDVEGAAKVQPFLDRFKLTFPVALDPESKSSRMYGANNLPSSFLIGRQGQVIAAAKGERDWFSRDAVSYVAELLATGSATAPAITAR